MDNKWEGFEIEKEEKKVRVPIMRAHRGSPQLVVEKPNRWGFSLKQVIRQAAKRLPEYHLKIYNERLPLEVETEDGSTIIVDTLGRWAFGVPGYRGHLMFEGGETGRIIVYYPEESPAELVAMLQKAIAKLYPTGTGLPCRRKKQRLGGVICA